MNNLKILAMSTAIGAICYEVSVFVGNAGAVPGSSNSARILAMMTYCMLTLGTLMTAYVSIKTVEGK